MVRGRTKLATAIVATLLAVSARAAPDSYDWWAAWQMQQKDFESGRQVYRDYLRTLHGGPWHHEELVGNIDPGGPQTLPGRVKVAINTSRVSSAIAGWTPVVEVRIWGGFSGTITLECVVGSGYTFGSNAIFRRGSNSFSGGNLVLGQVSEAMPGYGGLSSFYGWLSPQPGVSQTVVTFSLPQGSEVPSVRQCRFVRPVSNSGFAPPRGINLKPN